MVAAAHERFRGFPLRPRGAGDGHHDTVRFGREPVNEADGSAPLAGFDVVTLDSENRGRQVPVFLDRVPAGA